MSFMRRRDIRKRWASIGTVAMVLTSVTMAFLAFRSVTVALQLLRGVSAPVRAAPAEAERMPADEAPREPATAYVNRDVPAPREISASEVPPPEASPAPQPGVPPAPESAPPIAGEQRILRTRRALETVDPRELLRQGNLPR